MKKHQNITRMADGGLHLRINRKSIGLSISRCFYPALCGGKQAALDAAIKQRDACLHKSGAPLKPERYKVAARGYYVQSKRRRIVATFGRETLSLPYSIHGGKRGAIAAAKAWRAKKLK